MENKKVIGKMKNEKSKLVDLPAKAKATRGVNKAPITKRVNKVIKNEQTETKLNTKKVNTMNTKTIEIEAEEKKVAKAEAKAAKDKAKAEAKAKAKLEAKAEAKAKAKAAKGKAKAEEKAEEKAEAKPKTKAEIKAAKAEAKAAKAKAKAKAEAKAKAKLEKEKAKTLRKVEKGLSDSEYFKFINKSQDEFKKDVFLNENSGMAVGASLLTSLAFSAGKSIIQGSFEGKDLLSTTVGALGSAALTKMAIHEFSNENRTAGNAVGAGVGIGLGFTAGVSFGVDFLFGDSSESGESISSDSPSEVSSAFNNGNWSLEDLL